MREPDVVAPATTAIAGLTVTTLGSPGIMWNRLSLGVARRQARALLYRLAVRLEPVPREQLCFLFWDNTPELIARRHLTHLLNQLRCTLPAPGLLITCTDHVRLHPGGVWCDAAAFVELCNAPRNEHCEEGLRRAVELYRGAFLAGFSLPGSPEFEAWADAERCALERLYLEALATLVKTCIAGQAYTDAIGFARRYLATDDLDEEMHRHLIELYAVTGDRAAAQRQFNQCTAILERELGVSPLPETRAAYDAAMGRRLAR